MRPLCGGKSRTAVVLNTPIRSGNGIAGGVGGTPTASLACRSGSRISRKPARMRQHAAPVQEWGDMVHVIASIRVKQGSVEEYAALFKENVQNVLAEDGCLQYAPCRDAETGWKAQERDPQRITVVEQWTSMDALQAHAKAPHMAEFRQRAGHLVEDVSLRVLETA